MLQAHNTRLAEKRAQYEAGLKALREQVTSLEAVQADMVKESQQITADLERMKTIQASLKTVESLARKGELVEAKGVRGFISALRSDKLLIHLLVVRGS